MNWKTAGFTIFAAGLILTRSAAVRAAEENKEKKLSFGVMAGYLHAESIGVNFGAGIGSRKVEFDPAPVFGVEIVRHERSKTRSLRILGARPKADEKTIPAAGLSADLDLLQVSVNRAWFPKGDTRGPGPYYGAGLGYRRSSVSFSAGGPKIDLDDNSLDLNLLLGWQTREMGLFEAALVPDEGTWSVSAGIRYGI